jgi:hypothetical protein
MKESGGSVTHPCHLMLKLMNVWNLNLHIHLGISVAWCLGARKLHFYSKFENSEMKKRLDGDGTGKWRELCTVVKIIELAHMREVEMDLIFVYFQGNWVGL